MFQTSVNEKAEHHDDVRLANSSNDCLSSTPPLGRPQSAGPNSSAPILGPWGQAGPNPRPLGPSRPQSTGPKSSAPILGPKSPAPIVKHLHQSPDHKS